jgi:hypothetical protein
MEKSPQKAFQFRFCSETRNCRKKLLAESRLIFSLDALRAALFVLLAFGHDGGAETAAEIVGQFVELGVAIDFDGFLGGVANDIAIVAPGEMVF